MLKSKKRNNQKGFTLIELIVVIAVLGILAVIVFPKLTGFKDKAYSAQVRADASAIATAVESCIAEGSVTADTTVTDANLSTDKVFSLTGLSTVGVSHFSYEIDGGFSVRLTDKNGKVWTASRASSADKELSIVPVP